MWTIVPETVEPDFVTLLVTTTDMYAGSGPFGGGGLLPASVVNVPPHVGDAGFLAKPLKAEGAGPPFTVLEPDHWSPQKVTVPVALPSATTKAPPPVPGAFA